MYVSYCCIIASTLISKQHFSALGGLDLGILTTYYTVT